MDRPSKTGVHLQTHAIFYSFLLTLVQNDRPIISRPECKRVSADLISSSCYSNLISTLRVPTSYPGGPDGPVKIKVISGRSFGVESPIKPLGGCWFLHIKFSEIARIFHKLPIGWVSLIYGIPAFRFQSVASCLPFDPSSERFIAGGEWRDGICAL